MKIKIGVTDYDVTLVKSEVLIDEYGEDIEEDGLGGWLHPLLNQIKLNKDLPQQAIIQTFFHELTHGMLNEIGQGDLFHDEDFVDAFSKQIYGFLKNNKLDKIYAFLGDK